jgi:hypothetical protein
MGLLPRVISLDEQLGEFMYTQRNSSAVLRGVSDALTLSGDEVIFFGLTAALAITMSLLRGKVGCGVVWCGVV